MPLYQSDSGPDLASRLLRDNQALTARVTALEGRRPVALDRVEHTTIPAPYEGQIVVELDDTVWYYSNSTWRQFAGSTAMWPMSYELMPRAINGSSIDGAGGFFSLTEDLTYAGGYFYNNGGDASVAYFYLRLGPQGSIWGINLAAERGPDCGILNFDLQTISEDSTGNGYGLDGQGMIPGSTDRTVGTFYTTGSTGTVNLYNAVQTKNRVWPASYSQFRIYGSDGTALAANGIYSAADGYYRFLSGAGIYCLRMRVNGKHVDSSAYATRINSLRFTRYTSDGFPTG